MPTIAEWEAHKVEKELDEEQSHKVAKKLANWDDFESEVDEAEFEAMLEETDEEMSDTDEMMNDRSEHSDQASNTNTQSSLFLREEHMRSAAHEYNDGSETANQINAVHQVFGIYELVETILLNVPAHEVLMSCRLVQQFWKNVIDSASSIERNMSDVYVATLVWPPKATPEYPDQLIPFRSIREKYFSGRSLTPEALEDYREEQLHACMRLNSAYHAANQADPSLPTLESGLKGKYEVCRVCRHLHERFRMKALHPAIAGLCHLESAYLCFTGYGPHIVLQIQVLSTQWEDELRTYVEKLLDTMESWNVMPVGRCPVTRFTLAFSGSLDFFTTFSYGRGPRPIPVFVGSVIRRTSMMIAVNTSNKVKALSHDLNRLHIELQRVSDRIDNVWGHGALSLKADLKTEKKLYDKIAKKGEELDEWTSRDVAWFSVVDKLDPAWKLKCQELAQQAEEQEEPRFCKVYLHMAPAVIPESRSPSPPPSS